LNNKHTSVQVICLSLKINNIVNHHKSLNTSDGG